MMISALREAQALCRGALPPSLPALPNREWAVPRQGAGTPDESVAEGKGALGWMYKP